MKPFALALTLTACNACTTDGPRYVTPIGDDFEGTWSAEVAQAAQEWTDVGCPIYVSDDGVRVSIMPVADWHWHEDGDVNAPWLGIATEDGHVYLRAGQAPANRHKILLHEFGHVLGLEHQDWGIIKHHVGDVHSVTTHDCNP